MAGIAHRVVLTPATCAHSDQESVGLDDVAPRCLDANRPGHQHRPVRYPLHPHALGHGLSARITTKFSLLPPPLSPPATDHQPARPQRTAPPATTLSPIN